MQLDILVSHSPPRMFGAIWSLITLLSSLVYLLFTRHVRDVYYDEYNRRQERNEVETRRHSVPQNGNINNRRQTNWLQHVNDRLHMQKSPP